MQQLRKERVLLGSRLQAAREAAGLTKEEAAELAEVRVSAIEAWEKGRSTPCLIQFRDLITHYGVLASGVLFGENPFELSSEERIELSRAAVAFSPGLRSKVDLVVTMLTTAHDDRERQAG